MERTEIVQGLLERHGQTFADEAGIHLTDAPKPLFRLLCLTVLLATRMRHSMGVDAARALGEAGLDTPEDVADHRDRVRETLTGAGYVRYDESKADQLAQSAAHCRDAYDGDLRRLRGTDDLADRLTEFTGIGEVGAEIFLREVQAVWPEVRPVFGRSGRSGRRRWVSRRTTGRWRTSSAVTTSPAWRRRWSAWTSTATRTSRTAEPRLPPTPRGRSVTGLRCAQESHGGGGHGPDPGGGQPDARR